MSEPRGRTPFQSWQWGEIVLVVVLIWTQIALSLVFDQVIASLLAGLVLLGLLVHIATWMLPLVRARKADTRG